MYLREFRGDKTRNNVDIISKIKAIIKNKDMRNLHFSRAVLTHPFNPSTWETKVRKSL